MRNVLITGLSGTGKSSVIAELTLRGYEAIDAGSPEWSKWRRVRDTGSNAEGPRDEWLWQEDRLAELLVEVPSATRFVAGCASNQGPFHRYFDRIILLSATPEHMLERLDPRWDLRIATDRFERFLVLQSVERVLPQLRQVAHEEIDTTDRGIVEVAERILELCLEHQLADQDDSGPDLT